MPSYRVLRSSAIGSWSRTTRGFATVSPSILNIGKPPPPPQLAVPTKNSPSPLDSRILSDLGSHSSSSLPLLISQYLERGGHVLPTSLPYESRPAEDRRIKFDNDDVDNGGVVLVAHVVQAGEEHKITVSSGFVLKSTSSSSRLNESLIVTCAHTLEEIRHSPLLRLTSPVKSGTFIISGRPGTEVVRPVSSIPSALPRSDLILLSCLEEPANSLPMSPYPAHSQTHIRAHFVAHERPNEGGWSPWLGGTWYKWCRGTIVGYRDFAGRESRPGTYDFLSHLLFTPLPTVGSSGGPIVDEESGAVIGVMLGSRMDSRVEGVRGWGVPSEAAYEMFSLPGLEGKR